MKKLFENWQKFLDENDALDKDGPGDDAEELRDMADELEGSGGSPDMLGLVEEHDLDYEGEPIGFFLSLVREASGAFMEQREQDLTGIILKLIGHKLKPNMKVITFALEKSLLKQCWLIEETA